MSDISMSSVESEEEETKTQQLESLAPTDPLGGVLQLQPFYLFHLVCLITILLKTDYLMPRHDEFETCSVNGESVQTTAVYYNKLVG